MREKRKLCVFTSTRADYGVMKPLLKLLQKDARCILRLIVAGGHLDSAQGMTCEEIARDGFTIDAKVPISVEGDKRSHIAEAMGRGLIDIAQALEEICPDLLVVLGDRYELLVACSAALVMRIPIAHISGGDVTEGALDNQIRHAVSKMASLHFPGDRRAASRLERLGEDVDSIFCFGELGLDRFSGSIMTKQQVAEELGLPLDKDWVVCTYHPETLSEVSIDLERVETIYNVLTELTPDLFVIVTAANTDFGGWEINERFKDLCENTSNWLFIPSAGDENYIGLLAYSKLMIGNSSSGVIESASFELPVVTIGNRQSGRLLPENIIFSNGRQDDLQRACGRALSAEFRQSLTGMMNPYGEGTAATSIADALLSADLGKAIMKGDF